MNNEFSKFIKTDELTFKYAKGMRDILGKEIHPYHEIFFYIGGNAKFVSESGTKELTPHTTIIIPKETFHCFINSGDDRNYIRCVFNFQEIPELDFIISKKLNKIFFTKDTKITDIFIKLQDLADKQIPDYEKNVFMKSFFMQLLVYLEEDNDNNVNNSKVHNITQKAIEYIKNNIDKPLSIKELSRILYVSESYLSHVFKNDLHIPIHRYILKIRLTAANKKIKNSVSPTQAAIECGFHDYSGFYKQYKKMFGVVPRDYKKSKTDFPKKTSKH